ncbi:MAG: hypothetical protein ACREQM_19800 [Candidatus Dormibacteraceae bacterium]
MQTVTPATAPRTFGRGESFIRWLLRIPDQTAEKMSIAEAERSFSFAMLLSATRCIVGYGIAPIALPLLGLAPGIEPWIDIPIGCVALVFDVRGIRRFWLSEHRHRNAATVLYALVILFVLVLLVRDVMALLG